MTGENKENGDLGKIVKLLEKAAQGAEEAAALAEAELEAREEHESTNEGFRNQFHFNDTCLLITIIFLFAFIYKKELMKCLK
tara:strand:- start:3508 stop:3753 length:246 start_codon:yes stop_codon:yes gene_type:complete